MIDNKKTDQTRELYIKIYRQSCHTIITVFALIAVIDPYIEYHFR